MSKCHKGDTYELLVKGAKDLSNTCNGHIIVINSVNSDLILKCNSLFFTVCFFFL